MISSTKAIVLLFAVLTVVPHAYSHPMTGTLSREQVLKKRNNDISRPNEQRQQLDKADGIHFGVDSVWQSEPVAGVLREDLATFLGLKSTRDIFLTVGGTKDVEEIPVQSSSLKQLWEERYGSLGANYVPKHDDVVVGVDSVVTYPGISLMSRIFVGIKSVMTPTGGPELNILLLSERRSATLSGPLSWFSKKESPARNAQDEGLSPSSAKAHTRVSIVETDEGSYAFQVQSKIDVDIELPAFLMRAMPKEYSEEFGNRAIMKSIAQDTQTALNGARESFLKWMNERRQQQGSGSIDF